MTCRVKKGTLITNLIGCINELHTLVRDGEDDGRDFSHLFCRPLEGKMNNAGKKNIKINYYLICIIILCFRTEIIKEKFFIPAFWHMHPAWIQYLVDP